MLVEPYTDIGRRDLYQFGKWIEQTTADRKCAANQWRFVGEFLCPHFAGRVVTRAGFVNDYVFDIFACQLVLQNQRNDLFGLTTSRTVSDCDHIAVVSGNHVDDLLTAIVFFDLIAHHSHPLRFDLVA